MELHVEQYGDGPPLIIMHGFLGSGENWRTLSRDVFGVHYSVYTPDLRNHGRSPHDDEMNYDEMADDIADLIIEEGLPTTHLLGHSMGGKLAMQIARKYPAFVDRLIVVDIAPKIYPPEHNTILAALSALDVGSIRSRKEASEQLAPRIPDPVLRQFLLKNLAIDPETKRYDWIINLSVLREQYEAIRSDLPQIGTVTHPTLFIRGGRSDYIQDQDWPRIEAAFPNAQLATIPEVGHWVHAEAPQAFTEHVLQFLSA